MSVRVRVRAALLALGLCIPAAAAAQDPAVVTFQPGDVFLSIGGGVVVVYRADLAGAYVPVSGLFAGPDHAAFRTTGSAFDQAGNFYVTLFNNNAVSGPIFRFQRDFDPLTHLPVALQTYGNSPESIAFDAAGNLYVGHRYKGAPAVPCVPPPPGVTPRGDVITKIAPDGTCLAAYEIEREGALKPSVPPPRPDDTSDPNGDFFDPQGADWIDLARDQRTLFYTSAGRRVMRFDTIDKVQLPDFADLSAIDAGDAVDPRPRGQLFALRLLSDGSVLVADNVNIKHLNPGGGVIRTFDLGPADGFAEHDNWFSLNLDPNGQSFWSGDGRNGLIHRFNIATGQREATIDTPFADTFFGVAVFNELTEGSTAPPPPPPPPPPAPITCECYLLGLQNAALNTCSTLTLLARFTCNGDPLVGKTIAFSIDDNPVGTVVTDDNGFAMLAGLRLPPSDVHYHVQIRASFAGDQSYAPLASTADLSVNDFLPDPLDENGSSVGTPEIEPDAGPEIEPAPKQPKPKGKKGKKRAARKRHARH